MRIVVAMSGGVDSALTAARLVKEGHEVIGIHMRLHDIPSAVPEAKQRSCCGLDDAADARAVAARFNMPFYTLNLREAFREAVMDPFISGYAAGDTPSPCVACNGVLKFRILLQRARALGADKLATGHYARLENGVLRMAVDRQKDQSYFLFPLTADAREHAMFPLGHHTKAQVREEARALGLEVADKPESMDVCFIPDGNHARLIRQERPDLDGSGEIVDMAGHVLGHHDAYWRYTVGQRRGLGVANSERLFVVRVDPQSKRVVIGSDDVLWTHELFANGMVFHEPIDPERIVGVRVRHRGDIAAARVETLSPDTVRVQLLQPLRAAAPGQAMVIYDDDRVLGGGWLRRASEVLA